MGEGTVDRKRLIWRQPTVELVVVAAVHEAAVHLVAHGVVVGVVVMIIVAAQQAHAAGQVAKTCGCGREVAATAVEEVEEGGRKRSG